MQRSFASVSARFRLVRTIAVFGLGAFLTGPRLDHLVIDAEVLVALGAQLLRKMQCATAELACDVGIKQTVAIDAEDGAIPHGVIHAQADEAAEQRVVVELFDVLALAAADEEDQHEQRTLDALRVVRRNPLFQAHFAEHRCLESSWPYMGYRERQKDDSGPESASRTRVQRRGRGFSRAF